MILWMLTLPARWLLVWFLPGKSCVPLQKGNLGLRVGLAGTWAPAPPGHTDAIRAIWIFIFKHGFQRHYKVLPYFPMGSMGCSRAFLPCSGWESNTHILESLRPYTVGATQNMQPKRWNVLGSADRAERGSQLWIIDSRDRHTLPYIPKALWTPAEHIAWGKVLSALQHRSGAGQEPAVGWVPAESPNARGILSWESLAACRPSSSAAIYIHACMYSRTFKGIIIFHMSSGLTKIFIFLSGLVQNKPAAAWSVITLSFHTDQTFKPPCGQK